MTEQDRKTVKRLAAEIYEQHQSQGKAVALGRWVASCRDLQGSLQDAVFAEAGERFFGEIDRRRRKGLRHGYVVERNGEQLRLAILEQRFVEARATCEREAMNADGAVYRAEYDRFAMTVCEERCRERGLNPEETMLALGEFADADEIDVLWKKALVS